MSAALFVTGTDTGVGKTVVACGILAALRREGLKVGALKPVETGWTGPPTAWPPDAGCLARAAGLNLPRPAVVPYVLSEPLAPAVAARRSGVTIDPAVLDAALAAQRGQCDLVVVEGAGGLAVPVTDTLTMADLALRWNLPLVVVARPGLGTINHTVLTVDHARRRGLRVLGVIISGYPQSPGPAEETSPEEIARLARVPVLGRLPRLAGVDVEAGHLSGLAEAAAAHLDLAPIRSLLEEVR